MAINRKLGRTTDIRVAMLKTQLSDLILNGKIPFDNTHSGNYLILV